MEPWLSSEWVCRAQGSSSAPRQFSPSHPGGPEEGDSYSKGKDMDCCSLHIPLLKALSMGFPQAPLLSPIAGPWLARGQDKDFNPGASSSYHALFSCESQLPVRFQGYGGEGEEACMHASKEHSRTALEQSQFVNEGNRGWERSDRYAVVQSCFE